jgi:endonuclease/exonuclease/phosphatase family metal-dependent hydrolase
MQLKVLTFNTWGVPLFSRDRAARMRAIGRALATMDLDVALLQEVFYPKDRHVLIEAAAAGGLTYTRYFDSGLVGSGLLTLSRYPIVDSSFLRFRLNGRPQDLIRSDYYAGKGVGRVRIATPAGPVDAYNAHFIAPYLEWGPDRFATHRVAQALEAGQHIVAASAGVPAIFGCDLNCYPDDDTYRTLLAAGGLTQACAGEDESADRNEYASIHPPSRYDYIFALSGSAHRLTARQTRIVLGGRPEPNPEGVRGYSDHYGVLTEFELTPAIECVTVRQAESRPLRSLLQGSLGQGIEGIRKQRRTAGLVAAAASVGSAALWGKSRSGAGAGRIATKAILAGLLLAGGLNLSTAARLGTETRTLAEMLGEEG